MPNIRRTFPGRSVPAAEEVEEEDHDVSGGRNFSSGNGGKLFGKALRPVGGEVEEDDDDDDDSEEDDDSDEDDEVDTSKPKPQQYAVRGSGKHLASSGKYLRPNNAADDDEEDDDDDEEEEEEEEEAPVVKIQSRSGGKNILRIAQPDDDDDEEDDEEEEDDEAPTVAYRVEGRGGGKSLSRMTQPVAAPEEEEEDDDDDSDEDDEVVVQKVTPAPHPHGKAIRQHPNTEAKPDNVPAIRTGSRPSTGAGGKMLLVPHPGDTTASSVVSRGPSGGKVLRRPQDVEDDPAPAVVRGPSGGKVLRRPPDTIDKDVAPSTITRGPDGGKMLRRPQEDEDEKPAMEMKTASTNSTRVVGRSPDGGKVLRRPEPEADVKVATSSTSIQPATSIIARSPAGGKVLRRPKDDDDEEDDTPKQAIAPQRGGKKLNAVKKAENDDDDDDQDDDDMSVDDDDDDDDDDFEVEAVAPKKATRRPQRAAAVKAAAKTKIDEEMIGDDDLSSDEELDINNTEALIKDEADRKYLDSLPELEREAILGERFDKLKEKQDLQKAIAEARRKTGKETTVTEPKNKRKAPVKKEVKKKSKTDKDEDLARKLAGTRSSARSKDVSGAKSKKAAALAALKRQRKILQDMESSSDGSEEDFGDDDEDSDEDYEEVGLKPWQKKAKAADKLARSSSISRLDRDDDDSDMDIDDDDEKVDAKKVARTKSESGTVFSTDAALEDFLKVTIPRRRLARWCNEPFFDAAVLECFVRLFIGEDDQGEKVYRLCEIVDVKVDKRSYKFPVMNKNETPISTNKILRLKFGNNEKDFPMNLVSDTPPTELDVQKYVTTQKNNRAECLSKRRATKLHRTQDHLISTYTYTTEDIERNLLQRKKEGKSMSNLGSAQTKIAAAVQGAKDVLQDAEHRLTEAKKTLMEFSGALHEENELEKAVEECTRAVEAAKVDLEDLLAEERATLTAVKNRTMKLTGRERDQNWAKVNQRAVQMNQRVDRESYKLQKELDARKAAGEKEKFNPYARRKVKPKILWEVGQSKDESAVEEVHDSGRSGEAQSNVSLKDNVTTPVLMKDTDRTTEAAAAALVSESHQFVIDEEGLAAAQQLTSQSLGLSSGGTKNNAKVTQRVRKGISLTEYLDRKEKGTL